VEFVQPLIGTNFILSSYAAGLQPFVKKRYIEKISFIRVDPYCIDFKNSEKILPPVSLIDIYNYFVLKKSAYTGEQLKAYKSLESYNFFISGWMLWPYLMFCRHNLLTESR
jgi:hypothetical protein